MKIYIISISDSDKHFSLLLQEYTKRLPKNILHIIDLKPYKSDNHSICITKDTENIIGKIKNISWHKIMLSKNWNQKNTQELLNIYIHSLNIDKNIIYIIWWPYWLDENIIKPYIHEYMSFGKITMPHWLAKLVLIEQIYRIESIRIGKEYHY